MYTSMSASGCIFVLAALILTSLPLIKSSNDVRNSLYMLNNGYYRNFVIVIDSSVQEDPSIIPHVRDRIIKASEYLHRITYGRTQFDEVFIVAPDGWELKAEKRWSTGRWSKKWLELASAIITNDDKLINDDIYVNQYQGCGYHGDYIHMTSSFFKGNLSSLNDQKCKEFAVQFAHLRWGVFTEKESFNDDPQHFYVSDGEIVATRCSSTIEGRYVNVGKNNSNCLISRKKLNLDADCKFIPDINTTATSSILYSTKLPGVDGFCSDKHNSLAPNAQNHFCDGRSTWDVIQDTPDFTSRIGVMDKFSEFTTPNINVVKGLQPFLVLVIDSSADMRDSGQFDMMRQAVAKYLMYTVESGTKVGIVKFQDTATVRQIFLKVADRKSREQMLENIPKRTYGESCVTCGIDQAVKLLVHENSLPYGQILVLTSGRQAGSGIQEMSQKLFMKYQFIDVDTIVMSQSVSDEVVTMSTNYGGRTYYAGSESSPRDLMTSLDATFTTRRSYMNDAIQSLIYSNSHVVTYGEGKVTGNFYIDENTGHETVVTFTYTSERPIIVTLISPNNLSYKPDIIKIVKIIMVYIPGKAQPGIWVYTIRSVDDDNTVYIDVTSKSLKGRDDGIKLISFQSDNYLEFTNYTTVMVYAQLTKGTLPIINADVIAHIERPDRSLFKLTLKDNGIGADTRKYDGFYSGLLTASHLAYPGYFSIHIIASNHGNDTKLLQKSEKSILRFRRELRAGMLYLKPTGNTDDKMYIMDVIPPPKLRDFRLCHVNPYIPAVELKWSAVEDDTVSSVNYEVLMSNSSAVLQSAITTFESGNNLTDFGQIKIITRLDLIDGSLWMDRNEGDLVKICVNMTQEDRNMTYYFIARAVDESTNRGKFSQIVGAVLKKPNNFDYHKMVLESVLTTTASPEPISNQTISYNVTGLVLGVLFVVIIIIAAFLFCRFKKEVCEELARSGTCRKQVEMTDVSRDPRQPRHITQPSDPNNNTVIVSNKEIGKPNVLEEEIYELETRSC